MHNDPPSGRKRQHRALCAGHAGFIAQATQVACAPFRALHLRMGLVLLGVLMAVLPGCGDPCRDLSDSICNCMPSRQEQQACRKRVHNLAAQGPKLSDDERQVCHNLLQSCSCEALAAGDYAACGLAHD